MNRFDNCKLTYYKIGARSAWDTVEIGPFLTREEAQASQANNINKGKVIECHATGLHAAMLLENLGLDPYENARAGEVRNG